MTFISYTCMMRAMVIPIDAACKIENDAMIAFLCLNTIYYFYYLKQ